MVMFSSAGFHVLTTLDLQGLSTRTRRFVPCSLRKFRVDTDRLGFDVEALLMMGRVRDINADPQTSRSCVARATTSITPGGICSIEEAVMQDKRTLLVLFWLMNVQNAFQGLNFVVLFVKVSTGHDLKDGTNAVPTPMG